MKIVIFLCALFVLSAIDAKPLKTKHRRTRQLSQFINVPSQVKPAVQKPQPPVVPNKSATTYPDLNVAASSAGQYTSSLNRTFSTLNYDLDEFDDPIIVTLVLFLNNRTKRAKPDENRPDSLATSANDNNFGKPDYDKLLSLLSAYSSTFQTAQGQGYTDPILRFVKAMTSSDVKYLDSALSNSAGAPNFKRISTMIDSYSQLHPQPQVKFLRDSAIEVLQGFLKENSGLLASSDAAAFQAQLNSSPNLDQLVSTLDTYTATHPTEAEVIKTRFIQYLDSYGKNNLTSLSKYFNRMRSISDVSSLPDDLQRRVEKLSAVKQRDVPQSIAAVLQEPTQGASVDGFVGKLNSLTDVEFDDFGLVKVGAVGLNGELITDRQLIGRLVARKTVLFNQERD